MKRIYAVLMALCLFLSSAVVAEAAEWIFLSHQNYYNGDIYYDRSSIALKGDVISVKLKVTDKKYASKYFIIDANIRKEKVGSNPNTAVTVHKVYYTKQDEYTNDGSFVGSQQRNDYIGIVEIDYKQFKPIIDYAYANAPVAPGSEPNLKQKRWQPVASSYTKAMVYVNPDSIKDLPDGNMALEFMFDSPPNALVLEGYVDKNDQFHVGKYKLYNGIHCRTVEQGNNELPYPSLRTGAKDAIEMARHLQKKYNLH